MTVTIGTAPAALVVAKYTMDRGFAPAAKDILLCMVRKTSPKIGP